MKRLISHLQLISPVGLVKDDLGNGGGHRTSGVGPQPLDLDVDIERKRSRRDVLGVPRKSRGGEM